MLGLPAIGGGSGPPAGMVPVAQPACPPGFRWVPGHCEYAGVPEDLFVAGRPNLPDCNQCNPTYAGCSLLGQWTWDSGPDLGCHCLYDCGGSEWIVPPGQPEPA